MEKRTSERMLAVVECHRYNEEYFGTIVNASKKGMFIRSQKLRLPLDILFDVYIPMGEELMKVQVKIIRMTKLNGYYDSIGVEVVNYSSKYLSFVDSLRLI